MFKDGHPSSDFRDILEGGVRLIQWREKDKTKSAGCALGEMCSLAHDYGALFIVNDDPILALRIGADGVHIGQDDGDISAVRALIGPDRLLGVSAHNQNEAAMAVRMGADYLGVGAIFISKTKKDTVATSLSVLEQIAAQNQVPVFAIGGITLERWRSLKKIPISGVAVSGDLKSASDKKNYVREFIQELEKERVGLHEDSVDDCRQ